MRTFDFYEFAGVIAPGTVVLWGAALLQPKFRTLLISKDLTVGGLGLFVILAYVAGQLVQAVGNGVETVWWRLWGGMPTDWIRTGRGSLLSEPQAKALHEHLGSRLKLQLPASMREISAKAWMGVTRQVYAAVAAQGRAGRIDTFNGNYGLNRGIVSSLLVLSALAIVSHCAYWRQALLCLAIAAVALSRMHRFGKHYARELFIQFLQLPDQHLSGPGK
ncbi:MAG TPA: hypothetical protein VFD30_09330 [Terriglobia bacterium]|jgi:hypothetical protein|nr:hypothetical protein [Terriglobia bacterium]